MMQAIQQVRFICSFKKIRPISKTRIIGSVTDTGYNTNAGNWVTRNMESGVSREARIPEGSPARISVRFGPERNRTTVMTRRITRALAKYATVYKR